MADPTPNWDNFPCLDGILQESDIEYKGNNVPYVRWMRIMAYLAEHAPGWQFALREYCDPATGVSTPLYKSGDGTAYIMGYFRAPTGSPHKDTTELVYPVMDFRSKPVQYDKVSARDLSDTERRCRCVAAAVFFRLGWKLWTKDPLENPYRDEEPEETKAAPVRQRSTKPKANTPPKPESVAKPEGPSVQDKVDTVLRPLFEGAGKDIFQLWTEAFKANFKLAAHPGQINGKSIKTEEQFVFTENFINEQINRKAS